MKIQPSAFLVMAVVAIILPTVPAFTRPYSPSSRPVSYLVYQTANNHQRASSLFVKAKKPRESSSSRPIQDENGDGEETVHSSLEELERARESFERALEESSALSRPRPRMLSSTDRMRREIEIELLESLVDNDDAVEELMDLWLHERDAASAEKLVSMEQHCSPGAREEEGLLKDMVAEYNGGWMEPASRLAALKYFQGDSFESEIWCRHVLEAKPWHFETLHVSLLNQFRLYGAQSPQVFAAARKTLPPLSRTNRRRRQWVEQAVLQAQMALEEGEAAAVEEPDILQWDGRIDDGTANSNAADQQQQSRAWQ